MWRTIVQEIELPFQTINKDKYLMNIKQSRCGLLSLLQQWLRNNSWSNYGPFSCQILQFNAHIEHINSSKYVWYCSDVNTSMEFWCLLWSNHVTYSRVIVQITNNHLAFLTVRAAVLWNALLWSFWLASLDFLGSYTGSRLQRLRLQWEPSPL